ncbi:MAG: hypothetical protein ACO3MW_04970 [Rhodospirillales bacterium]|jgi:hypothetical protein
MKLVRLYTGDDNETHIEQHDQMDYFDFTERNNTRTAVQQTHGIVFAKRDTDAPVKFHNATKRQYGLYLSATVELGMGDGSSVVMEPGDILLAEDTTGHGHTSKVLKEGMVIFVRLED